MTKIHRVRKHFLLDLRHKTAFWNHAYNRKIKIYRQILQLCDSIGDKGFFFLYSYEIFPQKIVGCPITCSITDVFYHKSIASREKYNVTQWHHIYENLLLQAL